MGDPPGWYVDEDLLDVHRTLVAARRNIGDVHGPPCNCGTCPDKGTKDPAWFEVVAPTGWAIITHDGFKHPGEREAVVTHGLGVFLLKWLGTLTAFERALLVMTRWEDMLKTWNTEERPFIASVTRHRPPRLENL